MYICFFLFYYWLCRGEHIFNNSNTRHTAPDVSTDVQTWCFKKSSQSEESANQKKAGFKADEARFTHVWELEGRVKDKDLF